ncbi:TetR/AcrR family transcriptional regulator [Streptomyces sp. SID3343]|uniref:TetR/AcrR family transcriptional regulator n=1 Tax=Streptomyces sp. SID3343 TaxID=2690260 RepID=UPI001370475A|nr:TetR/AcrR family transcriptional regulator [Streptomyces sp. SID3343]MYW00589.1 TetR family transcriptional regulator [Streptomyces sp. SID3343]
MADRTPSRPAPAATAARGAGRPRDPAIDGAVLAATLDVLREQGYAGFALETVAARAGTTKATMRRRWSTRQRLIIAALATVLVTPPVPDSGCTRCDLTDALDILTDALVRKVPPGVLAPLVAECAGDAELNDHLIDTLLRPTRTAVAATVAASVARGDIRADADVDLIVDVLGSVVYQRGLFAHAPLTEDLAVRTVDLLLRGAATDFDRLVAISRAKSSHPHRHS